MKAILIGNKGFTLIESLIAIVILIIAVLGIAAMQGTFSTQTVDRTLQNSLIDAASSALTYCSNLRTTPPSSYTYEGGLVVNVSMSGRCDPALNVCNQVTATASARDRTFSLSTLVCNFR